MTDYRSRVDSVAGSLQLGRTGQEEQIMAVQDCGHDSTGSATTANGRTMCYGCADSAQAACVSSAKAGDVFVGYLSNDGRNITTWSGGVLMSRVTFGKRHPFSQGRYYLSAVDADARVWSGTGEAGMWARLRLTHRKMVSA